MEDVHATDELAKLMAELSWLKRLANALVRDENDARDLVQETWLVASEHAPSDGRPLRPWLGRVALNLVRMRSRGAKRRRAREASTIEQLERPATPDVLVDRLRAQRVVADEILRLAEPYRNTILLHYFEDLSSAEIARRTGVPEGTVRRRLKVALDELRARLRTEERTTGRPVIAALAPLTVEQSAAKAALGAIFVKKAIAIVVVVIGLLLVGSQLAGRTSERAVAPVQGASVRPSAVASPRATRLVVTVADEHGGPVADALVRCAPVDGEVVVLKTASDGNVMAELAAGAWSISASAEGREPRDATTEVTAGHDARVSLVLARGGQTLTGTVTDLTGGVIAGARMDAGKPGGPIGVAFSDRDGRYKVAVGAGTVLVAASHPEYAPQTRYTDGTTADFALVPGGVIEGIVRDRQTNEVVAGAVVRALRDSAALELAEASQRIAKADRDGKFRFAGLRPGGYELVARDGARSSRVPVGVAVGIAEQQTEIVVLVGATAAIRGRVVDERGAPAPGVAVSARGDGVDGGEAIANDAGTFVLAGLPPSRWVLRANSATHLGDGNVIVPLVDRDVDGIVVRARRGVEVRGHVEPRGACDVAIAKPERGDAVPRRQAMTTSADGAFHFAPFGTGTATLVVRCPDGSQGTREIAVGTGEHVVRVAPGGSIAGRVVDEAGKPLAGVMVNAEASTDETRIEGGAVTSGLHAMTSPAGAFEVRGLAAAAYRLSVLDAGRPIRATKARTVALAAGEHATGIEVVVERPTGIVEGTVLGPDGAPLADAWVALHQTTMDAIASLSSDDPEPRRVWMQDGGTEGRDPPPVLTDARGRFAVRSLLRGRYQVVAEAQAGKLRGGAVDVTTDARITIRLARVGALRGSVRGPRGPTDLFTIVLKGPIDPHAATGPAFAFPPPTAPPTVSRSFTDGVFAFPRLEPGDYTLEVQATDGTAAAKVRVSSDAATVDIVLVPNGIVTGRLVNQAGEPLSGIGVVLVPDQPPGQLNIEIHALPPSSGPDGRFSVEGSPGTRTLAILGTTMTAKRGLVVKAGTPLDVGDVIVEAPSK